jgi:glycosyltransferase involved in cell wall biosynthesis
MSLSGHPAHRGTLAQAKVRVDHNSGNVARRDEEHGFMVGRGADVLELPGRPEIAALQLRETEKRISWRNRPHGVAILLALYNGAGRLADQLQSYLDQTHDDWSLLVSDDGSSDSSNALVSQFAVQNPERQVQLLKGPRKGFAANFLSLLCAAGPHAPFAALSDQDDVWLPGKLERAVRTLAALPQGTPAIYCSRSLICDAELRERRISRPVPRPPGFANALVQNVAAGNTMLLNRAALDLVQAASKEVRALVSHDWWIYQLITGAGGQVVHDDEPSLLYRQHSANLIGANDSTLASLWRMKLVFEGRFRKWNDLNIAALRASAHRLTPENRELLERFSRARRRPVLRRLGDLRRCGVYRQSLRGNVAMWIAAIYGLL